MTHFAVVMPVEDVLEPMTEEEIRVANEKNVGITRRCKPQFEGMPIFTLDYPACDEKEERERELLKSRLYLKTEN